MSRLRPLLLSALTLALALAVTWLVWRHERRAADAELSAQLDYALRSVSGRIEQRISAYEQILLGAQGMMTTLSIKDRQAFSRYVQSLQLDANFTGIQTVGLVELVSEAGKAAHLAHMRRAVIADYSLHPDEEREFHAPIIQREPYLGESRNPLGYDTWSEPVRRQSLERSRDTGQVSITGKLRLQMETEAQVPPGFIMYLPLFAPGLPHDTPTLRRANLVGWVYISFRMTDFMNSLYGEQPPGLNLQIHDGVEQSQEHRIYQSGDDVAGERRVSEYLLMAGHTWTLTMSARQDYPRQHSRDAVLLIAVGGTGLATLLALLTWVMVTAQARAQRIATLMTSELRESEQRWAFALEGAGDGVWDWNLLTGEAVNSPRWKDIVGCSADCDLSTIERWKALIHPEDRGRVLAMMDEYISGAAASPSFALEYRLRCCRDSWTWVLCRGMIIARDDTGKPVRIIGTLSDITERKSYDEIIAAKGRELEHLNTNLAASNTELEMFAYVASHDLREPLRMVSSYLSLLERRYGPGLDKDALEFLGYARDGAKRMDQLVLELLDFSRIDRRGSPLTVIGLSAPLAQATGNLRVLIKEAGASIIIGPELEEIQVLGDASQIARLFQNIIENALKYRSPNREPVIRVEGRRSGDFWDIRISDNGIGIEPQYFERIFGIFQRLHTRDKYDGTGIGLAVCKKIIERHGGTIGLESEPDRGTTFIFTLRDSALSR
ncbi:MAG: CHASE domain-containing protein [Magnetospirillum sp.]|nr:CHASE domain-containing protein [Magnetospirillum sp.]